MELPYKTISYQIKSQYQVCAPSFQVVGWCYLIDYLHKLYRIFHCSWWPSELSNKIWMKRIQYTWIIGLEKSAKYWPESFIPPPSFHGARRINLWYLRTTVFIYWPGKVCLWVQWFFKCYGRKPNTFWWNSKSATQDVIPAWYK